jgi:hypothetical protein
LEKFEIKTIACYYVNQSLNSLKYSFVLLEKLNMSEEIRAALKFIMEKAIPFSMEADVLLLDCAPQNLNVMSKLAGNLSRAIKAINAWLNTWTNILVRMDKEGQAAEMAIFEAYKVQNHQPTIFLDLLEEKMIELELAIEDLKPNQNGGENMSIVLRNLMNGFSEIVPQYHSFPFPELTIRSKANKLKSRSVEAKESVEICHEITLLSNIFVSPNLIEIENIRQDRINGALDGNAKIMPKNSPFRGLKSQNKSNYTGKRYSFLLAEKGRDKSPKFDDNLVKKRGYKSFLNDCPKFDQENMKIKLCYLGSGYCGLRQLSSEENMPFSLLNSAAPLIIFHMYRPPEVYRIPGTTGRPPENSYGEKRPKAIRKAAIKLLTKTHLAIPWISSTLNGEGKSHKILKSEVLPSAPSSVCDRFGISKGPNFWAFMEEKAWAINPFFASISLEFGLFYSGLLSLHGFCNSFSPWTLISDHPQLGINLVLVVLLLFPAMPILCPCPMPMILPWCAPPNAADQ